MTASTSRDQMWDVKRKDGTSVETSDGWTIAHKGETLTMRPTVQDATVVFGCGWDPVPGRKMDVDIALVLLGEDGEMLCDYGIVDYQTMKHPTGTAWLTGDNRDGEGDGDDEQIVVLLDRLPVHVRALVFMMNIYEGGMLGDVQNGHLRLFVPEAATRPGVVSRKLLHYDVSDLAQESPYENGAFMCRLERAPIGAGGYEEFVNEAWTVEPVFEPFTAGNCCAAVEASRYNNPAVHWREAVPKSGTQEGCVLI